MNVYYNENDPRAAGWLRELIRFGQIPDGEVDERSIEDVTPNDLAGFRQCHFFAGIGGWPLALRMAGWPDDRPVWTGSCPCQPFSSAGKGLGFRDPRHLYPSWSWLIRECRPAVIFGEQVASKAGRNWLSIVQADLEGLGYAVGRADVCAAGVGAPHWRQRLWYVGMDHCGRIEPRQGRESGSEEEGESGERPMLSGSTDGLVDGLKSGLEGHGWNGDRGHQPGRVSQEEARSTSETIVVGKDTHASPLNGAWGVADWLFCTDGKWRPVEPGTFPLVDGLPDRVGLLRGYGNAIVPQVAQAWIETVMEEIDEKKVKE